MYLVYSRNFNYNHSLDKQFRTEENDKHNESDSSPPN